MAMRFSVLASMLMVVGIVMLGNVSAQLDCGGDLTAVTNQCQSFVTKEGPQIPPSQECCATLANIDVPCFCQKYMTSEFEQKVDLQKVLYVARTCGCSVPSGMQCGSHTIPSVFRWKPKA